MGRLQSAGPFSRRVLWRFERRARLVRGSPVSPSGGRPVFKRPGIAVAVLLLCGSQSLAADPPAGRNDLHGDPLPRHALARLGTSRFRHPGRTKLLGFSADGSTLLSAGADKVLCGFDLATGKEVHQFPYPEDYVAFAPDGKTVAL